MLDVEYENIDIKKWASRLDGLKIAVVGDFHAGLPFFENWRMEKVVEKTNAVNADIILLVGDYVNGRWFQSAMESGRLTKYLSRLKAPLGVYAILGNHDYLYDAGKVRKVLNSAGITLLENSNAKVSTPKGDFYVAGIADPLSVDYSYSQSLKGIGKGAPVLFMAHTPDVFREIPNEIGITFSGHTHGGQVRLPFLGALYTPDQGFLPDLTEGVQTISGTKVIISRGLGDDVGQMLPRINNPPELVIIDANWY